jgi:acyl-CoA hydrolase
MSFLTAFLFQESHIRPELLRVDQVLFLKPVDVGSVLQLKSKITYCENVDQGVVMRVVTQGFNEAGEQAGNFNYLFLTKSEKQLALEKKEEVTPEMLKQAIHMIKPETYDDILDYHEATRRL